MLYSRINFRYSQRLPKWRRIKAMFNNKILIVCFFAPSLVKYDFKNYFILKTIFLEIQIVYLLLFSLIILTLKKNIYSFFNVKIIIKQVTTVLRLIFIYKEKNIFQLWPGLFCNFFPTLKKKLKKIRAY